jgi:hypothetical protein
MRGGGGGGEEEEEERKMMDRWKNKCSECGLELNVMVMNFVTAALLALSTGPVQVVQISSGHKPACPWFHSLVLFGSSICSISNWTVDG